MWVATAEHSRYLDQKAVEDFGIPCMVLVERAGAAAFDTVRELLPQGGALTVLCGKGLNGADGFVVARLARDAGFHVECLVAESETRLGDIAMAQMHIARVYGVQPLFADDPRWLRRLEALGSRELLVDALLGTGANRQLDGAVHEAVRAINRSGVPVVAVDVPSGIEVDTGEELGDSVWALRTVTFGLPKPFLFQGIGLDHAGHWRVDTIGFPQSLLAEPTDALMIDRDWAAQLLPERMRDAHKGSNGHVGVIAGSHRMRGAAALTARAAVRAGAGLVTVFSIPSVLDLVAQHVPEVLLVPLPERDGEVAPEAADVVAEGRGKLDAGTFGPGLGQGEGVAEFLGRLWERWDRPAVVDADALNVCARGVRLPLAECVLTPHPGELSRLLQLSIAEIQANRFLAAMGAAQETGHTVLLKGAYSLVADGGQPVLVNSTGNSGLATGGTGDVLTGVVGTLLAQELPPYFAGGLGMYWHGLAADACAEEIGEVGYLAHEVADCLPRARAKMVACA